MISRRNRRQNIMVNTCSPIWERSILQRVAWQYKCCGGQHRHFVDLFLIFVFLSTAAMAFDFATIPTFVTPMKFVNGQSIRESTQLTIIYSLCAIKSQYMSFKWFSSVRDRFQKHLKKHDLTIVQCFQECKAQQIDAVNHITDRSSPSNRGVAQIYTR